ncbi:YceI family protein [Leptothrix ochracea]|uniref:YceI family protein n=1 Tax=Leptothrix ochracea TaxID=735331 RepID=UPI0034E2EEC7
MKKTLIATLATAATLIGGAAQAESASYTIEPNHTYVTFEIGHFGTTTNRGRFDKKEGTVQLDRAAKKGKVEVTFDVGSINTGSAQFDKHLRSEEILKTEAFPKATFIGDKFTFNGDKVSEVSGQLTLLGKTNPITLKASNFNCYQHPMMKREVCGGDFRATIKRSQWGVDYGMAYGFSDAMDLVIQVEAVHQ